MEVIVTKTDWSGDKPYDHDITYKKVIQVAPPTKDFNYWGIWYKEEKTRTYYYNVYLSDLDVKAIKLVEKEGENIGDVPRNQMPDLLRSDSNG